MARSDADGAGGSCNLNEIFSSFFLVGADFAPQNELEKFSVVGLFEPRSCEPQSKICEKIDFVFTP